jgi:ligand-binding sensor domain-containing protein
MIMKLKLIISFGLLFICVCTTISQNPQWIVYTTQNSGLPGNFIGSIIIDTNNIKWIGTNNGLARFDGNQWIVYDTTNAPVTNNSLNPKALDRNDNLWISIGGGGGVAKFDGLNWVIYKSTNSGLISNYISAVAIDPYNVKWIGTTYGLAKFNDINWVIYTSTNSGLPMNEIVCLAVESNIKWIGHPSLNNNAGLTKYNDTNWVIYTTQNSGLPTNILTSITIDYQGNKWITTQFGGVAKFNSIYNIWTVYNSTNSGLPDNNTLSFTSKNNVKWIGTLGAGLARYNDTSWIVFNPNNSPLPDVTVGCIVYDHLSNLWIGTTLGLAVYNPNGIIGIKKNQTDVPKEFSLYQNYPNPFNSKTIIEYEIPRSSFIKITIYNMLGKEVENFVNQKQSAGKYRISWDASNYPSGVYFSRIEAGSFTAVKKMVLIK